MNKGVNQILRERPQDAFASLSNFLLKVTEIIFLPFFLKCFLEICI